MGTPDIGSLMEDVSVEGLRRLTRFPSLKRVGMLGALPEGVICECEDARVLEVRGLFFRQSQIAAFASDRSKTFSLRAEPTNEHDPFAVAVDVDDIHAGYLPREVVAAGFQALVSEGRARVLASWEDFSLPVAVIYLVVGWQPAAPRW